MSNSMTKRQYAVGTLGAAVLAIALVLSFAPLANAQEDWGDWGGDAYAADYGSYGGDWSDWGGDWSGDLGSDYSDWGGAGDCCGYSDGYSYDSDYANDYDYVNNYNDCYDDCYGGGYSNPSGTQGCTSCGSSYPSYPSSKSFFSTPSYVYIPPASAPARTTSDNVNTNVNTNQNQNINNQNVEVNVNTDRERDRDRHYDYPEYPVRPPVVYNPPMYNNPPVYNNPPYIALSQTPYTGLELGFWGTILYWSFIVLWCLLAAYLIVVKKVHTRIAASMKNFLFGDDTQVSHPAYEMPAVAVASAAVAPQISTLGEKFSKTQVAELAQALLDVIEGKSIPSYSEDPITHAPTEDTTDPFILSQINRTN